MLLTGPAADAALAAVRAIARTLRAPDPAWQLGGSLANGSAGLAVFYGYLFAADPTSDHADTAARYLEDAIDAAATTPMLPSLHHGFTGVAWAMEHARGRWIDRAGADDADDDSSIEDALFAVLRAPSDGDFDLLTGLVGYAVYALERLPRASARALLELVVTRLGELAEHTADGARWPTPAIAFSDDLRARYPDGVYNVGLAHGSPGVIGVLSACVAHGIATAPAGRLLDDAVRWLLAQELPGEAAARFPDFVAATPGAPPTAARLAWCYGDLSIALALLHAGRVDAGRALAHTAAARSDATSGVVDACVCHGAAGLGLMFLRAAQLCGGDRVLEAAATRWYTAALAMRDPTQPFDGFAPRTQPGITLGEASIGLLTGAAGVGLALLAAITPSPPDWDRALLLSLKKP